MLALYEQIVMVTGVSPDTLRDYELPKRIPGLLASMETCADRLDELAAHLNAASGGSMSDAHTMESISERMRLMIDDPSRIAGKLYDYRDSIMQLSSSILVLSRSALCVDYISFTPEDSAFPRVNPSFTEQLASDARAFALSFFKDYNSIGNAYNAMDSITVWAMVGRDQADELKVLIDSGFTPETKINVNLNIISSESVLLYSAISGNPPDAALGISGGAPVDYGLRGAAMDLTAFDDYRQVVERFSPAAMTPFEYGESVYALPYTFAFPVMFYRTDVFEELGLEPPQTWEETRTVIQALQENNLTAGLMGTYDAASGLLGLTILNSMFFQNGAAYYNDSKTRCLLDSPEALSAFESYTDWFSLFSLPEEYDAYTRFRLGEMPLFIADFTQYNTLSVSAPEIKGLWKMAPIPGTALGDGRINAAVSSVSTASVIMERTEKADAAWKFLKWWTSAETQTRYSVNIEALLGAGGRYNSATVEALEGLDWRQEDLETIALGIEKAVGVPYIPGSYFHLPPFEQRVLGSNHTGAGAADLPAEICGSNQRGNFEKTCRIRPFGGIGGYGMRKVKRRSLLADIRTNPVSYLMMTPFLALFFLFVVLPVAASVCLSFTYYNMIQPPRFIFLENYRRLFFEDDVFRTAFKNTMIFAAITGPVSYFACLIFAWLLNELRPRVRAVATTLFYIPSMTSGVFIWRYVFANDARGLLNGWLMKLGFLDQPVLWLKDPKYTLGVIIIVQLWMSLGVGFLVFIAGLQGIDRSLYESAAIDGIRNRWQELYYITLPEMKPQLIFGAVLQVANSFAVCDLSAQLAGNPSPMYSAHTLVLHMQDYGSVRYEMGYAMAVAVILFVFTAGLTRIVMRFAEKG